MFQEDGSFRDMHLHAKQLRRPCTRRCSQRANLSAVSDGLGLGDMALCSGACPLLSSLCTERKTERREEGGEKPPVTAWAGDGAWREDHADPSVKRRLLSPEASLSQWANVHRYPPTHHYCSLLPPTASSSSLTHTKCSSPTKTSSPSPSVRATMNRQAVAQQDEQEQDASKRGSPRPRRGPIARKPAVADGWGLPSSPSPPARHRRSTSTSTSSTSTGREMAAVVRGPRAGRGGPGRAQGQQRGPAAAVVVAPPVPVPAAPQVNEPVAPPNLRWTLTWLDDSVLNKNKGDQASKIYRFLQKSPRVDMMELARFGVSEALVAAQPAGVDRMLNSVVDKLNTMMPARQRYLYKKLNGERGKEMSEMEKNLPKCVDRIDEKIQAIRDARGFCPHRPKLFDNMPNPLKKQE